MDKTRTERRGEPVRQGFRAYALLREALKESGRVGIGSIVLRQREHLTALRPSNEVLVLAMMKFAHELRPPDALNLPRDTRSIQGDDVGAICTWARERGDAACERRSRPEAGRATASWLTLIQRSPSSRRPGMPGAGGAGRRRRLSAISLRAVSIRKIGARSSPSVRCSTRLGRRISRAVAAPVSAQK
jgi:Ku70/Ku80-like protein